MNDKSLAQVLFAKALALPRRETGFCCDAELEAFLKTCRGLCYFSTIEEPRSIDSAITFVFSDSSRLYISNPKQTAFPAKATLID